MVRTLGAAQTVSGSQAITAGTLVTWAALDNTNGSAVVMTGKDLLLVRNPTAGSVTFTLGTVADPYGRTASIADAIAAGAMRMYGPLRQTGFQQSDGRLYLDASATGLEYAVLALP